MNEHKFGELYSSKNCQLKPELLKPSSQKAVAALTKVAIKTEITFLRLPHVCETMFCDSQDGLQIL